jgi:mannose-1-phosphate guanylyltransferase/mannose-6-phosphate isomerase
MLFRCNRMVNLVILCGGSGSRLWPLSREKLPKQLLTIINDYTMLQNTIKRCIPLSLDKITIICNIEHAFLVQQQVNDLSLSAQISIIAEPIGRDTAPAIAIASLLSDPSEMNLVVPCDHVFNDEKFVEVVKEGFSYCTDSIVTFGVKPTCPETGYGYIKTDISTKATIDFVEKPDHATALKYVEAGNYYWNAGVFLFRAQDMLTCVASVKRYFLRMQRHLHRLCNHGKVV